MRFCPRCGTRYGDEFAVCPEDGTPTTELPPESAVDPLLGTLVDNRYRIEKLIGEGGMGLVYAVTHIAIGKKLAMKVLRGEMARDPDVVQRFVQEAQSASSIGHENIISINDFGRLPDESVYFVMEYLDGESLTDVIARGGSIPVTEALHIIRQIASALGAAHARGIVHRDLKPDNIYLIRRGDGSTNFVKVLDFGIAKVGGASSKLTKAGMIFGTPHYMSPEQAAGQTVDHRTDIYALGVIMYEMFVGRVPFDADTFMGILTKHMFEAPKPLSQAAGVGNRLGALEDVTLKALQKKPEARFQSMAELIAELERLATGNATLGMGATRTEGLADALEPMSRTEFGLSAPPLVKSKTGLVVGIGVAVLVLGGVAAAAMMMFSPNHTLPTPVPPLAGAPNAPALPLAPVAGNAAPSPPASPQPSPAAPEVVPVAITSEPASASVFIDGALIGNTPVTIPRPLAGDRTVEVRAAGYATQTVLITSTSAATLNVTLVREALRVPRREEAGHRETAATPPHAYPAPAPQPAHRPRRPSVGSEVVDPWN